MRLRSIALAAIATAATTFCFRFLRGDPFPAWPTPDRLDEQHAIEALAEPSALNARHLPLREVIGRLSRRHRILIVLGCDALRDVHLTGNEPVDCEVSGVSLRKVLRLVLQQHELCYRIDDGAVVASTPDECERAPPNVVGRYLSTWECSRESRIVKTLDQTDHVEFFKAPLEEACRFLSKEHDIPIVINRRQLAQAGIPTDVLVTINSRGVSLRAALEEILRDLELSYVVDDEVLEITTPCSECLGPVPRVYPVDDIVSADRQRDGSRLVDVLTWMVCPFAWDWVGGKCIAQLIEDRLLLVRAQLEIHEEVEVFISQLRLRLHPSSSPTECQVPSPAIRDIELALRKSGWLEFDLRGTLQCSHRKAVPRTGLGRRG